MTELLEDFEILETARDLAWLGVADGAIALFEKCAEMAPAIRKAIHGLPELGVGYGQVFWNPDEKTVWIVSADWDTNEDIGQYRDALTKVPGVGEVRIEAEGFPPDAEESPWVKVAYSVAANKILEALQFAPSTSGIPNSPGPLQSMLAGGMLGAGLGYGVGAVGEQLLPRDWKRRRMSRTLAILGGLAGAAPGGLWMAHNYANEKPLNAASLFNTPPPINDPPSKGIQSRAAPPAKAAAEEDSDDEGDGRSDERASERSYGSSGYDFPPVRVNEFNHVIWNDPRVSDPIPYALQAAGSGLVAGAAYDSPRGRSPLVTPADIARIAVGMGTGYASGALVGKGLSLLFGLPQSTQERLKNVGLFAGVLKTLIPVAFGG